MKAILLCAIAIPVFGTLMYAGTVIGTANSENCIPWSCQDLNPGNYQQIYNSGAFSGAIDIGSISFYNTYSDGGVSQGIAQMDYTIYLAVTGQSVPDGSLPSGDVLFASGHLAGQDFPFGSTLSFSGTTFAYDPSLGNLELTVLVSNESGPISGAYTFFDAGSGNPFSRWCSDCGSNPGTGLVTGFDTGGTVPEPATSLLLGIGIVAIAAGIRRGKASSSGR
jgi:hypothetical protein